MDPETPTSEVTFYAVSSEEYFVGLVVLINSLRSVGHDERIVVLDCGLRDDQKALIQNHCVLMAPPEESARNVAVFKALMLSQDRDSTEIAVFIDSDMIVVRRLDAHIVTAKAGKICAFVDPESERWFGEWSSVFPLRGPLRRELYVNSGFIALSNKCWPDIWDQWWNCCKNLVDEDSIQEGRSNRSPVAQIDQDAFNAVLMSEVPSEEICNPPSCKLVQSSWQHATVADHRTLECQYMDGAPDLLHWAGKSKPWLWRHPFAFVKFDNANAYVSLARHLLTTNGLAVRLPDHYLPLRFRSGFSGTVANQFHSAIGSGCRSFLPLGYAVRNRLRRLFGRL